MKPSHSTRVVKCGFAALNVMAALLLLAGCIPAEPEKTPAPVPLPAPTEVKAVPAAPAEAKPAVQNETLPPDSEGNPRASLKMDTSSEPNASVTVESLKDGTGYEVRGTFNLSGKIVPNGPGKWKFSGQFSVAEPDFAVGVPEVTAMKTFDPNASAGGNMSTDASMVLIAIPVRPPAAQAPQGTAVRTHPVDIDISAPEKAQFTVFLSQLS